MHIYARYLRGRVSECVCTEKMKFGPSHGRCLTIANQQTSQLANPKRESVRHLRSQHSTLQERSPEHLKLRARASISEGMHPHIFTKSLNNLIYPTSDAKIIQLISHGKILNSLLVTTAPMVCFNFQVAAGTH